MTIRAFLLLLALPLLSACAGGYNNLNTAPAEVQLKAVEFIDRIEGCTKGTSIDQVKAGTINGCPDVKVQQGPEASIQREVKTSDGWKVYANVLASQAGMVGWVDYCSAFFDDSKHSCAKPANPSDDSRRRNAVIGTYLGCGRQNTSRNERQVATRLAQLLKGYTNDQLNSSANINNLPGDCYPLGIKQFGTFKQVGVARTKDGLAIVWSRVLSGTLYQIYATPISQAVFVRLYSNRLPIAVNGLLLRGSLPNSDIVFFTS